MQRVNRTGEIVLTLFGVAASIIGVISVIGLSRIFTNQEFINEFKLEMQAEGIGSEDMELVFGFFSSAGTFLLVVAIISLIVGIIATILLIGDKKPKAAGILLIITSVIVLLASLFSGFFAFLFYLIAGIMAVVRKPKINKDDEDINTPIDFS